MATYDSIHTGEEIDEAVGLVLGNKSKGGSSAPVYLNADGEAVAVTKDANPTENSTNIVESGGVYTQLSTKLPFTDVNTTGTITTSNTSVPSCGTVEAYVESVMAPLQDNVVAGSGIVKDGNYLSIDLDNDFMTTGKLDNKWNHFSPELEVGYGQDLVEEMKAARRSTFDESKFSWPASHKPTVTNDGIASGFSNSNYYYTLVSLSGKYVIRVSAKVYDSNSLIFSYSDTTVAKLRLQATTNNILLVLDGTIIINIVLSASLSTDLFYDFVVDYDGTKYNLYVYQGGNLVVSKSSNEIAGLNITDGTFKIGQAYFTLYNQGHWGGSIDLKQFSITVDGVEVFSGNKTGIDTVKPDDYTVVGTPTITDDGIASGFSSSNYLTKDISSIGLSTANSFEIIGNFTSTSISTQKTLCFTQSSGQSGYLALIVNSSKLMLFASSNGTSFDIANAKGGSHTLSNNTYYYYKIAFDGTSYKVSYSTDGNSWTNDISVSSSTHIVASNPLYIGKNAAWPAAVNETVNLNSFKIYVNGNLVYQPLLRIPYTQTIDGKKIVDVEYRDRVEDEQVQAGFTPYYTLDEETKGNYTVVGSPTINSDWIASGFSSSNYIITPTINFSTANSWKIVAYNTITRVGTVTNAFELITSDLVNTCVRTQGNYTGQTLVLDKLGSSTSSTITIPISDLNLQEGFYRFEAEFTGSKYIFSLYDSTNNLVGTNSYDSTSKIYYDCIARIGYCKAAITNLGSSDLNAFKIYVDGKEVYRAVTSPNYTMATVRNTAQQLLASTYSEDSTQFLRQRGACTADTAITLSKPYMDDTYFVSVPTSAKSKTGFTPTVTGDYIAEGYTSI